MVSSDIHTPTRGFTDLDVPFHSQHLSPSSSHHEHLCQRPLLVFWSLADRVRFPVLARLDDDVRAALRTGRGIFYAGFGIQAGSQEKAAGNRDVEYAVTTDNSSSWTLTLCLESHRDAYLEADTTLFLDTGDSDVTDMGACAYTMHLEGRIERGEVIGYRWTEQTLENSLQDNGDCKAMLGDS